MATVYDFAGFQATRDMVFGWCIRQNQGVWIIVAEANLETLEYINSVSLPAYAPDEFKQAIRNELAKLKSITEKPKKQEVEKKPSASIIMAPRPAPQPKPDRSKDKIELMATLLEKAIYSKTEHGPSYQLPYMTLSKTLVGWKVETPEQSAASSYKDEWLTLDEALDAILKRWW